MNKAELEFYGYLVLPSITFFMISLIISVIAIITRDRGFFILAGKWLLAAIPGVSFFAFYGILLIGLFVAVFVLPQKMFMYITNKIFKHEAH